MDETEPEQTTREAEGDVPRNEHLTGLGFRVEKAESSEGVERLLNACDLDLLEDPEGASWQSSEYLVAATRAGGIAACVGWNRFDDAAVLHSLAVAPSSRRNHVGASMFATALGHVMDDAPVDHFYLVTETAVPFFASFGFEEADTDALPEALHDHGTFQRASAEATPMVRYYEPANQRGLDQYAFRLIHNTTEDEVLPPGSVFFFEQSAGVVEANYRGTPVERGHLIGAIEGDQLAFLWHQYLSGGELMQGDGRIYVDELDDGRRELRESLGDHPGELLLREV